MFCVLFAQELYMSQPVDEKMWDWIQRFYSKVIDRLLVSTIQPRNDRTEQMLHLDASQLALIRVPIVHWVYHGKNWKKIVFLELKVSPKFASAKQIAFNLKSTQFMMSSCGSNTNQGFWFANFFKRRIRV